MSEYIEVSIIDATERLNNFAMTVNLDSSTPALVQIWHSPPCQIITVWLYKNGWKPGIASDIMRDLRYLEYREPSDKAIRKSDYEIVSRFVSNVDKVIADISREVYGSDTTRSD